MTEHPWRKARAERAALPVPEMPGDGEGVYLPGEHTVAEVLAYVATHPDQRQSIYDAEEAGKARVTLLEQLAAGA